MRMAILMRGYLTSTELEISLFLLRRLLGVKTEDKKQTKVSKLVKNELLLINISSTPTGGRVLRPGEDPADVARVHGDRGEGRALAPYREALAACRSVTPFHIFSYRCFCG